MSDGAQDYKTLRVPEDAWADAKGQKEAADRTWGEQIVRPEGDGPKDLEQIERELDGKMDFPTADVKEAMRQVLRDELPDGALR